MVWWSIAWGLGVMALSPLVNLATPFLNPAYANQWAPDVYWRLVMYWHGGLFIPWIVVLAVIISTVFKLDEMPGTSGRLVKESIFVGGFFAVPINGIASIFDIYDHFAFSVPLLVQIGAFLVGDEIAIALIVAMLNKPRLAGGYRAAGLPFYTVLLGVSGALISAVIGHVGGTVMMFGPNPAPVSQYINSTMYPVLGYYNSSAVIVFTENTVGSHSHLMIVALMAGMVGLVGATYGYMYEWSRFQKGVARFGYALMAVALMGAILIYVISGVGNYSPPSFFVSGPNGVNGVAGDDLTTATVGLGAAFVLAGLVLNSGKTLTPSGTPTRRDPLFLVLVLSWLMIYAVIPITGFYINFNEVFFKGAGSAFDDVFTRFHQDFGFFVLPIIVTLVLSLNAFPTAANVRRPIGYLILGGEALTFVFGEAYILMGLGPIFLYVAVFGGLLIGSGALLAAKSLTRTQPQAV
jgi:hypothetical protein